MTKVMHWWKTHECVKNTLNKYCKHSSSIRLLKIIKEKTCTVQKLIKTHSPFTREVCCITQWRSNKRSLITSHTSIGQSSQKKTARSLKWTSTIHSSSPAVLRFTAQAHQCASAQCVPCRATPHYVLNRKLNYKNRCICISLH